MQDLEAYLRFDVDSDELSTAVDTLVSWNNTQINVSLPYLRRDLSEATVSPPRQEFLPMPWWDLPSVTSGYFRGHNDSYALKIIVDQDRSRIYVYQND